MDIPMKRMKSKNLLNPPTIKLQKFDREFVKSPIIGKNLWVKILSYLDYRTYNVTIPVIITFFRSLVNKETSSENFVSFAIQFKADHNQNKPNFVNKKEFAKNILNRNLLKRLYLIFINLDGYTPDYIHYIKIHSSVLFKTVKYMHLKIDSLGHLNPKKFFSFFTSIKSLKFDLKSNSDDLLLIFDLFFPKNFVSSNYFKDISAENTYIPNNLKRLWISTNLEKSREIDLFEILSLTKKTQLREIVIKDCKRKHNLNFKALGSFCCSDRLVKLKLPVFCLTNNKVILEFCLYIGNTSVLKSLTVCTILLEFTDAITSEFIRNRSLTKLHFIGIEATIKDSLCIINSISSMNVINFSLASREFHAEKLCKEYIKAIDQMLLSSKIIKLDINIENCSFKWIKSLAEVIVSHAQYHNLEWFIKHNLKFCLQNRLEMPSVSNSHNYSTNLAYEVFKQIIYRIKNMLGFPANAEDFRFRLQEMIKSHKSSMDKSKSSIQVYYYSLLSIKYPDLDYLNLKSIELNSESIYFLEVLKDFSNLKTLKLCITDFFNPKDLLYCLAYFNAKLENLILDFNNNRCWRESCTKMIGKLNHLRKLHLIGANIVNSDSYISSVIQNLQVLKLSYLQLNEETFPYLLSGLQENQCIINIKLNKIVVQNYDECIAMQELLEILKEKSKFIKISIRFNNLNPSLIIQTRDIYMDFIQAIDLIVLNNKKLTEFNVLIPVYYKFLTEYSFHIYEIIKTYKNLEIINTFKIKNMFEDNFSNIPEELTPSERSECNSLPDTSRFVCIMPIVISQIFVDFDRNFVAENYFSQELTINKLDFSHPYVNPLLNMLVFSMIRIFEDLQVFVLGNILFDSTITCVLSWNIALLPNLRKIELKGLKVNFEEIQWVFSARKLKSLKLYDVIFFKKDNELDFRALLQSAEIEKLCLRNVIYNNYRKDALFTMISNKCKTCRFDIENQSMIFDIFSGCKVIKLKYACYCVKCANIAYAKIKEFPMLKEFSLKIITESCYNH
ncbi:hypothetical protein SteCoe_9339 [Stentor coeruleus]|uniref:Uncharacterized protein n=1 Tax=Stentor coeruleus TaxID=5963 RepID=A0A1R2CHX5_9CILI|nr:hypothetical protein SteCoe_9339 [Stentor coeruleus]